MGLGEHVFLYCERGRGEALLAEPFNAASNAAFLLAALVALLLLLRRPKEMRSGDHFLLIALVFLIGLGSLAFHLLADRASLLADVVPIDVFLLVYLGFALNRFLGVPPGWTVLTLIGFGAIVFLTMQLKCWSGGIGFPGAEVTGASECLNGSLVYLPALLAMAVVGGLLAERRHPAAPFILWAALIFAISVTFRSLDLALCDAYEIQGRKIGTHFVWHLLNGLALFLLLRASLEVGARGPTGFLPNEGRGLA
jgi:Ceramidase